MSNTQTIDTINTDGPVIDPTRRFYVSAIDDTGRKHSLLLGPFLLHAEALSKVNLARSICYEIDHKAPWYRYGTCSLDIVDASRINGILNEHPLVTGQFQPESQTEPDNDPFD